MGYNRKLLSEISNKLSQRKDLAKPKDIIKDPEGQWKFPGQPTRIPSSNITMKGVPYPVLGVGSTGQKQMMYPNQEYTFPGSTYVDEFPQDKDAMNAMMKARLAYANEFGNPAAQRMITLPDQLYDFGDGNMGSHYMASMDNYAVPQIQDVNGKLVLGDFGPESNEAIRFDRPEDAEYFAEHYKDVSPAFIEAELTDKEIEEYKKGGYIIEELPEAQEGGINKWWEETAKAPAKWWEKNTDIISETGKKIGEWGQKVLEEAEAKKAAEENDFPINLEGLKKGIAHVESADGVLMKNPSSSATGLYGQLFSEQGMSDLYSGTRDEFAKDIDAQNRIFEIRLNQGIGGNALIQDAKDLKKEYAPQIKDFNKMFSNEDIIVLDNFLGRQGTRKYFGNVIRDGKSLAEVFPHLYGKDVAAPNHTPEVYLSKARSYYKKQDGGQAKWRKVTEEKPVPENKRYKQSPSEAEERRRKEPEEDAAYERWLDQNLGPKKEEPTYKYIDPITNRTIQRSYNDKQIIPAATRQVDPEKLKAFINSSADPREALEDLAETAFELTGVPSLYRTGERIIEDPVKFVGDVGTTIGDIIELPIEGAMTAGSYLFGDGNNYIDVNTDALNTTLELAGGLPVAGLISKGAKPLVKASTNYLTKAPLKNASKPSILSKYKNIEELRLANNQKTFESASKDFPDLFPTKESFTATKNESKKLLKKYKPEFEKKFGKGTDDEILLYGAYDDIGKLKSNENFLADDAFAQRFGLTNDLTNQQKFLGDAYQLEFSGYFNNNPAYGGNKKFAKYLSNEFEPVLTANKLNAPTQVKRASSFSRPVKTIRNGEESIIPYYELREGDIIYPEHNWSTTTDLTGDVWGSATTPVARINVPQGQSGFRPNMFKNSQYISEEELVLPSELGYKVSGVNHGAYGYDTPRFIFDIYNPYKQGGSIELNLTPKEIQKYIDEGYIVEELPQAQDGLTVADVEAILSGNAPIPKQDSLSAFIARPEDQVEPVIKQYDPAALQQALKNAGIDYSQDDEIIKNMPVKESSPWYTITAAKEEEPFSNQRFSTPDIEKEIFSRQEQDNRRYGKFMSRGKNIANRTDVKRNLDSEIFFADIASPNSVIIDIGSALGNTDPKLAGVSVWELTQNPKIKDKKIKVIATDIPEQVETFKKHNKDKKAFDIDYAEVPKTFNTPIDTILKSKNLTNKKDVYLRAANSIDLLMNPAQTKEHFDHIAKTLKNKNVTYVFNNIILFKPAGKSTFTKLGNINNAAYDHKSASWKTNKDRKPYTLLADS